MNTFPQYDGSEAKGSQWGRRNTRTSLKVEANWIPFIQVGQNGQLSIFSLKILYQCLYIQELCDCFGCCFQVKPRRDPWQQKVTMKLKEKNSVDELLKMHSKFLQVILLISVPGINLNIESDSRTDIRDIRGSMS